MLSQHFSYPSMSSTILHRTSAACTSTSTSTGMFFFFFLFTHPHSQHLHPIHIHIHIPSTSASYLHPHSHLPHCMSSDSDSYSSAVPDQAHPLLLRLARSCSLRFSFPTQRCALPLNSQCAVVKISLTSELPLFSVPTSEENRS